MTHDEPQENPPIFNLPPVIVGLLIVFISLHLFRAWLLPARYVDDFILLMSAIPARYGDMGSLVPYPSAAWYSPITHALIHSDWTHLFFNMAWMLAFGSPVAKRFGTLRFLLLAIVGALAGFGFHMITHMNDFGPMLGASGAVSAFMGAAIRLQGDVDAPVLPLTAAITNRTFVAFVSIWFVFNLLIGLYPELITGDDTKIAWQAHVGGFLTGLLLFRLFDPKTIANSNGP